MVGRPNILFVLADQLRASSLPLYANSPIETPAIDKLAAEGTTFDNMVSTCPVCTPYRSMMLTGRHPQTTGHIINFVNTRHDEISLADVLNRAGYRTGWVGKWHLHRGSFPTTNGKDFVPEGRDRLGLEYWRAYNFHATYFNGWVNTNDWHVEQWEGYETDALGDYAADFLDQNGERPFCLFVSPHQPHFTPGEFAPRKYYGRLPEDLKLLANVPEPAREDASRMYRHYLAMTLAVDDLLGRLTSHLERLGKLDDTLVIFTSDHGTQAGSHADEMTRINQSGSNWRPWMKSLPYETSMWVPMVMRLPHVFRAGSRCDTLTAPVDLFPSLCSLLNLPIPTTVEGYDLSGAWLGRGGSFEQDALLTMNFSHTHDYLLNGQEWRGVRTKRFSYDRWLSGEKHLYDLKNDRLQMNNLSGSFEFTDFERRLEERLSELLRHRGDNFGKCEDYVNWFDAQRRVVRNAYGPLDDPEAVPDWSLLKEYE